MYLFLLPNAGGFADIRIYKVVLFDKYFEEFPILNRLGLLLRMVVPE